MFRQHATSSQACVTFSQCSQISYLIVDSFFLLLLTALLVTHPFSPFALLNLLLTYYSPALPQQHIVHLHYKRVVLYSVAIACFAPST